MPASTSPGHVRCSSRVATVRGDEIPRKSVENLQVTIFGGGEFIFVTKGVELAECAVDLYLPGTVRASEY